MNSGSTPNSQHPTPNETLRAIPALGVGRWRLGICPVLIICATVSLPAQQRVQSTQEILENIERRWVEAFMQNDVAFVDSVLAPEFVATYGDGARGNRARELQLVKEFNYQVDEWTVSDFTVKVFGDTAVVWFTQRMVGPIQGKPTEIVARYMDVFVNRDGRWLCVGSQSTRVTAPESTGVVVAREVPHESQAAVLAPR